VGIDVAAGAKADVHSRRISESAGQGGQSEQGACQQQLIWPSWHRPAQAEILA